MMHGYLAFDADGELLTPFRTWRNTNTGEAAERLSDCSSTTSRTAGASPTCTRRSSTARSTSRIAHLTTLAGYVHWQLTGERVLGVGDASGMFPIDIATGSYDPTMMRGSTNWSPSRRRPAIGRRAAGDPVAGEGAGELTEGGRAAARPDRAAAPGIPMCPPEGDAGTGMVATNSVAPRTGNVSAGTSIFAMVVLERELGRVHRELDLVTTPAGDLVAMVHCNNGASELDAWVGLFAEFAKALGQRGRHLDDLRNAVHARHWTVRPTVAD